MAALMAVTREARYLSGNDIGKTITTDERTGIIEEVFSSPDDILVYTTDSQRAIILDHSTPVTITGQSSKDK